MSFLFVGGMKIAQQKLYQLITSIQCANIVECLLQLQESCQHNNFVHWPKAFQNCVDTYIMHQVKKAMNMENEIEALKKAIQDLKNVSTGSFTREECLRFATEIQKAIEYPWTDIEGNLLDAVLLADCEKIAKEYSLELFDNMIREYPSGFHRSEFRTFQRELTNPQKQ